MWALAKMGFSLDMDGARALLGLLHARLPSPHAHAPPPAQQPPPGSPALAAAAAGSWGAEAAVVPAGGAEAGAAGAHGPPAFPLNAQELSNVLYALARFRQPPEPRLMAVLLEAVRQRLPQPPQPAGRASGPAAPGADADAAASSSGQSASAAWQRGGGRGSTLNAQEMANVLWCLSQLQVQPSDAWLREYWAAVQWQIRWGGARVCQCWY